MSSRPGQGGGPEQGGRPGQPSPTVAGIRFSRKELLDLGAAWVALGVAFAIFLNRAIVQRLLAGAGVDVGEIVGAFTLSMLTVGVGFLLHELGHKVVAVEFGQVAEFRADYGMLGLAILAATAGFLFAAPGAVYHRGRITERQNGLIALAGPAVNVALGVGFAALYVFGGGFVETVGWWGLGVNLFLAAFNMIPFGPLDGKKVLNWSLAVYLVSIVATVVPGALAFAFGVFP